MDSELIDVDPCSFYKIINFLKVTNKWKDFAMKLKKRTGKPLYNMEQLM